MVGSPPSGGMPRARLVRLVVAPVVPTTSTVYPVAEVRHAGPLDDADELEFDRLGAEVVEEPPSRAQQYRDEVDLHLVEHTSAQERLGEIGAVHHDVFVAGGVLGLSH